MVLNGVVLSFSTAQAGVAIAFIQVVFQESVGKESDQEDEVLINWLALAALGVYGALSALFGICAAHRVSIDLLVMYFSVTILMIAPTLLFTFLTFEFQRIFKGWVRHRWSTTELSELRKLFCRPSSTADSECKAGPLAMPVNWTSTTQTLTTAMGMKLPASERNTADFDVESWCIWNYNSTSCIDIYNDALSSAVKWSRITMYAAAILSAVNIVLLVACLYLTYTIVTSSIIMKYMNTKVNAMLIVPALANLAIGLDLMGMLATSQQGINNETDFREINKNIYTIGRLYVTAGSLTGILMCAGMLSDRIRRKHYVFAYIALMFVSVVLLGVAGVWCLFVAHTIRDQLNAHSWDGGSFACDANLYGCSNCDYCLESSCDGDNASEDVDLCPEWTKREIIRYVQVYLKMAGLCALTSTTFLVAGIASAHKLAKRLQEYKCEYI